MGAMLRHMRCVSGKPCRRRSGGPEPALLTKMFVSSVWICDESKSSNIQQERSGSHRVRLSVVLHPPPWVRCIMLEEQQPILLERTSENAPLRFECHERLHVVAHDPGQWQVR